ncbi:MAG: hypothetical protein M3487_06535 [Actinomycetota bacterium]|nr:hypothetical protein [Acidimicrobiia bacterium]MDQ3469404.1 hypothetical protein [Actinomycetota bacterium]
MSTIHFHVLAAFVAAREQLAHAVESARGDERGELTGNVIFLAALAVAAAAVAAIIIAKLNSAANSVPGG